MKNGVVDKRYVHKLNEENVLICNIRRGVPTFIEKKVVESIILPALNDSQKAFFLEYYTPHNPVSIDLNEKDPEKSKILTRKGYILVDIPHTLNSEIIESNNLSQKDKNMLMEYYLKNHKTNLYVLKKQLSELEGKRIQKILGLRDIGISSIERVKLSEMLENIENFKKENVFYANMLVNLDHPFFFEHPQEHVPGMMVLEAARQLTQACWHIYGKAPLNGMQFILSQFNSKFFDYIDLNYPIELRGEPLELQKGKFGEWTDITFRTALFQTSEMRAQLDVCGKMVSEKLFHRLRSGKNETKPSYRFYPINSKNCFISLRDTKKDNYLKLKLHDISYNGFCLETEKNIEDIKTNRKSEFIIYFSRVGFVQGECCLKWLSEENGKMFAGYSITRITKSNKDNLMEAIRQFCHLRTDRERI